jgi:hypothetical protein
VYKPSPDVYGERLGAAPCERDGPRVELINPSRATIGAVSLRDLLFS